MNLDSAQWTIDSAADGEDVHQRLRRAILNQTIPPGTEVSQVDLAEALGVSRTPLREALQALEHEGLVHNDKNKRLRISGVSGSDLEDLYVMRITLETVALRQTIPSLEITDFAALEAELARMRLFAEHDDHEGWEASHRDFNVRLTSHAGQRLQTTILQLSDHAGRYRRILRALGSGAYARADREHRGIVEAAKARDLDLAVERNVAHLVRLAEELSRAVARNYEPTRLQEVATWLTGSTSPKQ